MKARTARLLASWVLVAAAVVSPVFAHTGGSTGYAVVAIDGGSVRYSLTLGPAASPLAIGDDLRRARAGDPSSRQRLLGFIRHKVTLRAGRRRCEPGPGSWPAASPNAESVTLVVDFTCGGDVRDLSLRDDLFDVFGADYHTLARIDAPGRTTQFAFTPETRETRVRLDDASGGRRPALARQLLLRPGPRLRLLRRAARARTVLAWAPALALRIQRRGRDRPGARRRGRRPGARARAGHALGAAHDLELLAGDPARRRRPVRRTGVLLTRPGLPGGLRDGLIASLALVPSVFVYGSVFGGLAVQAGVPPPPVLGHAGIG